MQRCAAKNTTEKTPAAKEEEKTATMTTHASDGFLSPSFLAPPRSYSLTSHQLPSCSKNITVVLDPPGAEAAAEAASGEAQVRWKMEEENGNVDFTRELMVAMKDEEKARRRGGCERARQKTRPPRSSCSLH